MQTLNFYLGNPYQLVPPPKNWEALLCELSFENTDPESILNASELEWEAEVATLINKWFTGVYGIFQGIPLKIEACDSKDIVVEGCADLSSDITLWNCDKVKIKIRDKRMDMISQLFNSVSFAYLAAPVSDGGAGIINRSPISAGGDYVVIPYQINAVPDYIEFFSMGLSIYNIADKAYDVINKLVSLITGTTIDFSTVQLGGAILGIIQIIGYVAYIVAMILVIIDMLIAAFHYLVSPVFTKLGMYAHTLMERASQYFGVPFYSTILQTNPYNRLVIMPAKPQWVTNETFTRELYNQFMGWTGSHNRMQYDDLYNLLNGGYAYGYYDGTPGQLMMALEEMFNARGKVIINSQGLPEIHFERWDYQYNLSSITFPQISEQAPFPQAYKTNASELAANYEVIYSQDTDDLNTYQYYEGTSCMCQTSLTNVLIQRNVMLKNLTSRQIEFALAFRKHKETPVEEVLGRIWNIASHIFNPVIGLLNGITNIVNWVINAFCNSCNTIAPIPSMPSQPAWAQTGYLLLSNHVTSTPKVLLLGAQTSYNWYGYSANALDPDYLSTTQPSLAARSLMKYFHFASLPLSVAPGAPFTQQAAGSPYFNQWKKYEGQVVPSCCADFNTLRNNNYVTLYDGAQARVASYKMNLFKGTANTDYWVRYKYCSNLQTTYIVDGILTLQTL